MKLEDVKVEELLSAALDEMLEGFQVIDNQWRYRYVNDTVAKQGKKKKEELLGRTMMEVYPGIEDTKLFEQMVKCKNEQVSIRMDNEFEFPDGSKGVFKLYITPWDGGIMIFSVDITDKVALENELYKRLDELSKVAEVMVGREMKMGKLIETIEKLQKAASDVREPGIKVVPK